LQNIAATVSIVTSAPKSTVTESWCGAAPAALERTTTLGCGSASDDTGKAPAMPFMAPAESVAAASE